MKKILLAAGMMASIALSSVSAFAEEKVTVYTVTFSSANADTLDKAMLAIMPAANNIFFIFSSDLSYKLYLTSY